MNDDKAACEAPRTWDIAYFGSEGSPNRVRLFINGEGLGMELRGRVVMMTPEKWHALAWSSDRELTHVDLRSYDIGGK